MMTSKSSDEGEATRIREWKEDLSETRHQDEFIKPSLSLAQNVNNQLKHSKASFARYLARLSFAHSSRWFSFGNTQAGDQLPARTQIDYHPSKISVQATL